ncbi:MAG: SsrA-binding protein SmpB [bacterium]|nr:SsrA-binding protein SmpB [bacterium]
MAKDESGRKVVVSNRKARHDYEILSSFECGIVLAGSEVKSLRAGQAQLKDAYGDFRGGELWLYNAHIAPYGFARAGGHDPDQPRKLLIHRREINSLSGRVAQDGLTLVPLSIYFTHGLAKVEMAVAKGIRRFDKRQKLKEREQKREIERAKRRQY